MSEGLEIKTKTAHFFFVVTLENKCNYCKAAGMGFIPFMVNNVLL